MSVLSTISHSASGLTTRTALGSAPWTAPAEGVVALSIELAGLNPTAATISMDLMCTRSAVAIELPDRRRTASKLIANTTGFGMLLGPIHVLAGDTLQAYAISSNSLDSSGITGTIRVIDWRATTIADGALTASKFAPGALNGKGDWNTVVPNNVGISGIASALASGVSLSSAAQLSLVAAIELELANDATGGLMQAIADKLTATFSLEELSLAAIAGAVWLGAPAYIGKLDVAGELANTANADSFKANVSGLMQADAYVAPPTAQQVSDRIERPGGILAGIADAAGGGQVDPDGTLEKLNDMLEQAGGVHRFRASALALAPTGQIVQVNTTVPQAAPALVDMVVGNAVAWSQSFTLTGVDVAGWTQAVFVVKADVDTDDDGEALMLVRVSNPSDPSDGLQVLNRSAWATASDAALVVDTSTPGTLKLTITANAAAMSLPASQSRAYAYEFVIWQANTKRRIGYGAMQVQQTVLRRATP